MNINHNAKFKEGWNAYWAGMEEDECPYVAFSSDWTSWRDGYYDARDIDVRFPSES
jgi:ribosome modulation factor